MKTWQLLAEYNAETKTVTACAGTSPTLVGGEAGKFTPTFNGRLVGLRTIDSEDAVTTLTEHVVWQLTSTEWKPNQCIVGGQGHGLATVPSLGGRVIDWAVDLPVVKSSPIAISAANVTADTPVGVDQFLYGCFEVGG